MAINIDPKIWKNWENEGKTNFLKLCSPLLKGKTTNPVFNKNSKSEIVDYITLLIYNGIQSTIRKEFVVGTLQELLVFNSGVVTVICDALNVADAHTSVCNNFKESQERQNFGYIVQECRKIIPEKLLHERLEIDTLKEFGILKNCSFNKKFIKLKTKLYYKQRKFNLFSEENEGYSKLLTELNQNCDDSSNRSLLDAIQSLIGCFKLDPNKVLVVILEAFEQKPKNVTFFVPLIRSYMGDKKVIAEILGYEYSFYKSDSSGVIPKSLYLLTVQLLHHELVLLEDVYDYLQPDDRVIHEEWKTEIMKAKEELAKIDGTVVTFRKEGEKEDAENHLRKHVVNQKVYICETLLNVGDWKNAKKIMDRLPPQFVLNHESVTIALCRLLHYVIEPVYRENCKYGEKLESELDTSLVLNAAATFLELRDLAIPMILALGPSLRFDPLLLYKITRLAQAALSSYGINSSKCSPPNGDSIYWDIVNVLEATILPTLSFMDCNSCVAEEIWNVLKLYPNQIRYCLYGRWKNETYFLYPDLLRKRCHYVKTIKTLMKSVTNKNAKSFGRQIAKLTNCSPTIILDYVLIQIQMFENITIPIVESLKYLTGLSYDVLAFSLIETLSNADEQRVKYDGTSISSWLRSLAIFCGAIFKKYNIELTGILQFFANQLKSKKSLDLIILNEIVRTMTGIEVNENMTVSQLNAFAGGDLLKAEVAYFSQIRNVKKSSMRLRNSMLEQNLAVALCLLTAQQTYYLAYEEEETNLKFVGSLIDQCQETLLQLGTFLGCTLFGKDFLSNLPSIQTMLADYHIPEEVAFFLARPKLNSFINNKFIDSNLPTKTKQMKYLEAVKEVIEPINTSIIASYPASVWEHLSPKLVTTFWSLSLGDIFVPDETYKKAVDEAKLKRKAILGSLDLKSKRKELERVTALIEQLSDENRKRNEHKEKIAFRLNLEKSDWFLDGAKNSIGKDKVVQFSKLCLIRRCTFSQIDAMYCAKFIYTIHLLKTPNFPTLLCYDQLLGDVRFIIRSGTENESMRYGRFLGDVLEITLRWHKAKEVFENECEGYPGFVTKFRSKNQSQETLEHVNYENYRHLCCKWQKQKLLAAIMNCLNSKEFVQIRNSLIVLIKILPYFPLLITVSQTLVSKIETLTMEEKHKRPDLELLAIGYLGQLKQKISSGCMVKEEEFHQIIKKAKVRISPPSDGYSVKVIDDAISTMTTFESSSSICNSGAENDVENGNPSEDEKLDDDTKKSDDVSDKIEKCVNPKTVRNRRANSRRGNEQKHGKGRYKFLVNYKSDGRRQRGNSVPHFKQPRSDNGSMFKRNLKSTESENPNKRRKT